MAEYFSPGVYVEEIDNSPRNVEGVGTSTAGFVGLAEKGPAGGAPVLVTNFKSFLRQFGGFLSEYTHGEYRYLANSVEQFFNNGGTRCFVARVVPDDAKAASKKMAEASGENDIKWNFTKFIINRDGEVVKRFEPTTDMKEVEEFTVSLL